MCCLHCNKWYACISLSACCRDATCGNPFLCVPSRLENGCRHSPSWVQSIRKQTKKPQTFGFAAFCSRYSRFARNQRLLNWGARRAAFKPHWATYHRKPLILRAFWRLSPSVARWFNIKTGLFSSCIFINWMLHLLRWSVLRVYCTWSLRKCP